MRLAYLIRQRAVLPHLSIGPIIAARGNPKWEHTWSGIWPGEVHRGATARLTDPLSQRLARIAD